MGYNYKQGQYAPKRVIPKPEPVQASSEQQQPNGRASPSSTAPTTAKPVKASAVAEETMRRADEYVDCKMTAITDQINTFDKAVGKIPPEVPVNMPEDVSKKLDEFKKNLTELDKKLEQVKKIKTIINNWLIKGLFFVAGIVGICFMVVCWTAVRKADADMRFKDADRKYQELQKAINRYDSAQNARDTYHDFGIWMVQRYGDYGNDFTLFKKETNRENKKW